MVEPRVRIHALAVPTQERSHCKGMSKPVNAGMARAGRYGKGMAGQELIAKDVADGVGLDRRASVPSKERRVRHGEAKALLAKRPVRSQPRRQARADGHETTLAKLAVAHEQHVAL